MTRDNWLDRFLDLLSRRRDRSQLRQRSIITPIDATHFDIDGKTYVNFSSNNYLGLTHHPRVLRAVRESTESGSGAAGLVTGHTNLHDRAERAIANWKSTESAILFPSGYQANLAAVQTLASLAEEYAGGVRFLFDKLIHASLIDAVRATGADFRIFPHNNIEKLRRLLATAPVDQLQIVLTESIFSMDGDAADLASIARLKEEFEFVLLLDEAHASGVYGPAGAGLAAEMNLQSAVDVSIVTLSKALGGGGGAVCGSRTFRDAILNLGRAYIYSTSIAPSLAASALAAIEILRDQPQHQSRVRALARRARAQLSSDGLKIPLGDSPVIPIILGSEQAALRAAHELKRDGLFVVAIRPPTVAPGAARLRITLSSAHQDDEIDALLAALKHFK